MSIIDKAMHLLAANVIVVEKVDAETAEKRYAVCVGCEHRDADKEKCKVCGCFLDLKTESAINRNPKKNRQEITHCPLGKWEDLETANFYRKLDGMEPLSDNAKIN